jgi:hypothetical protein
MRLFSEKVTPTFTSSNQNILTIKDFNEIFFDVYELEINGNKYIAEKVSEYKGNPVVNIPIVIEGKELEAPFVLQRGKLEVIFNESNSTFLGPATSRPEEVFVESKSQEEEVEEIIFEKKESILKEIQQARKLAGEYAVSIKKQNLQEAAKAKHKERETFFKSKEKFKADLIEEFLQLSNVTRDELFEYTEQENEKAYNFIVESITSLSDKLSQDLESTLQEQNAQAVELFESRVSELAQNILTDKLLTEITSNNNSNNKAIDAKFETVAKTLTKVLHDYEQSLSEKVESTLASYDKTIVTLEQSNIELNDNIAKNSNKALSRIGNVKTQLEGAIINASFELTESLTNKITLAESKIREYYNDRITLVEASVTDIAEADKSHILKLIEESKQSILNEVALIKNNVPTLVTEKTLETKGDVDVKNIKTDLEKTISNRFTLELANVRRIIELSSGGGSVAVQFANGGTMNGNLNINGQILSGGVDLVDIFSNASSTTINGTANQITVNTIGNTATISLPDSIITPGDLNVTGSLYVAGSSFQVNTTNMAVADSLIYMATGNNSDLLDIGIVGHYYKGGALSGYQHTGLVRNHLNNKWTLFSGVTAEPLSGANTIDLGGPDLIVDTLKANIEGNITGTTTANLSVVAGDQKDINFITNNSAKMTILSSGNVGIGTITPAQKLDVVGAIQTSSNLFVGGSIIYMNQQQALFQGANSLTLGNAAYWTSLKYGHTSTTTHSFLSGNVGIGTTTPYSKLHIAGSPALVNTTVEDILYLQRPYNAGVSFGQRAVFRLGRYSTESKSATRLDIGLRETSDDATISTTPEVTVMTLRADRKVGINTTTPNETLTVVGNISATGNVTASNLVYTTGDQTIAGAKTFSNNIVGNGTANRLPNQLAVASSDIITKGLADSRYTSRNERITDDTTFVQTTWEQFLDFDDQYNQDLTIAAASGATTFGASPAVFGDTWSASSAGVVSFSGNDLYAHRGIFLVRGPTANSQAYYIGINRTTIPYSLTNRIDEFTSRVFINGADFATQGYFKIGPVPKGGTGGGDSSLTGGLIFNPFLHPTNLVLGVNKSTAVTPFTFTTTAANVDFLDTGFNFTNLLNKWANITYKIDRTVNVSFPTITIIITRDNVVLFQASYDIATHPVVSTWVRRTNLFSTGASNEIGLQSGHFTYTAPNRSQLFIDYLHYKVTGTSAAPSNWNSLRF